jgi:hypothetical protein
VSGERREVRATLDFFHDLDRQLPSEAVDFDTLPALIQGRDDYRILIAAGVVVRAYSVVGHAR